MNRRNLLTAIPALGLAGIGVATVATAQPVQTPVEVLFREWQRLHDIMESAYEVSETGEGPEIDAASDELREAEMALMNKPCQSVADVGFKVIAATAYGIWQTSDLSQPEMWAEDKTMTAA